MPVLFTLATDRFQLSWSGPAPAPDATAPAGHIRVEALRPGAAVQVGPETLRAEGRLRLAEQTRYRVFARSLTGEPLAISHPDPLATRDLVADDSRTVWSGLVDFGGQVGRSRFVVAIGGEAEAAFEVDVLPQKATFADLEAMRAELDAALAGLAFEYLRSTNLPTRLGSGTPRRASWLTLLRQSLPDLEAALGHVTARPHRDLVRTPRSVRAERVRRPDAAVRRAVRTGQGTGPWRDMPGGPSVRSTLIEGRAEVTLDTPEHRWLRQAVYAAHRALLAVHREEQRLPRSARRLRVLGDLVDAERRLARLLQLQPLAEAAPVRAQPQPTQRLLTAPGYGEAYRACQRVAFGLALADGPVLHATRDLHALYEMWTYLTVVQRVAAVLGVAVPVRSFFKAEHRGLRLLLRRGHAHAVTFEHDGLPVRLAYNPRFGRPGLLAQRPDVLLTVGEGSARRRYVLDAKYRRDESDAYLRRYGAAGPPEDAIGDLHRYRDAILDGDGDRVRRTVAQAVALYPYRTDAGFAPSRLWTSIGTIGVGAVPLLPGQTAWLDAWLRDVLGAS